MSMSPAHPIHRYLLWLVLLVIALVVIAFVFGQNLILSVPVASAPDPSASGFPIDAPEPVASDYVDNQHGFQYLVLYTESGFSPETLIISSGETVRFTNGSSRELTLSLTGERPEILGHASYFEYVFPTPGDYVYTDGIDGGMITVK